MEYTREQLIAIATKSNDMNEIIDAAIRTMAKYDELMELPRSQERNRERKGCEYIVGMLKKRIEVLTKRNLVLAEKKKLRRLQANISEEALLKSLVSRLVGAKGNVTNHPSNKSVPSFVTYDAGGAIVTGQGEEADNSSNSVAAQYKAGKSFAEIAQAAREKDGTRFSVNDLIPNGSLKDEDEL